MITEQCISVTELKRDTKNILSSLKNAWPKVIFLNNKPIAVLTDIDSSNLSIKEDFDFNFGKKWIDANVILDYFDKEKRHSKKI